MQLALWDTAIGRFLKEALPPIGALDVEIELHPPAQAVEALEAGYVDVALVPTLPVLRRLEDFDILPAVALSTWKNPYVRLDVRAASPVEVRTVACDPSNPQVLVMAQMILKEHYGVSPQFVPIRAAGVEQLQGANQDAVLLEGDAVPRLTGAAYPLDLSQEWFELANYPFVWGLFVTTKGNAHVEQMRHIKSIVKAAEVTAKHWGERNNLTDAEALFFANDLRLRFDDLVVASLTEFQQQLFYNKMLAEVDEILITSFADDDGDDQELMV